MDLRRLPEKCALFRGIAPDDISELVRCLNARFVSRERNETLLTEGEPASYIGVLLSGSASVSRTDYRGNRSVLTSLKPGDLFGETHAFAETAELPVRVTAFERCDALMIPREAFSGDCGRGCPRHRILVRNLLKVLAEKNAVLARKIEILSKRTTADKLLTYLATEARLQHSNHVTVPFNRQELADYLEVDRSGLSTVIGKLTKEGVLVSRKNMFVLLQ